MRGPLYVQLGRSKHDFEGSDDTSRGWLGDYGIGHICLDGTAARTDFTVPGEYGVVTLGSVLCAFRHVGAKPRSSLASQITFSRLMIIQVLWERLVRYLSSV